MTSIRRNVSLEILETLIVPCRVFLDPPSPFLLEPKIQCPDVRPNLLTSVRDPTADGSAKGSTCQLPCTLKPQQRSTNVLTPSYLSFHTSININTSAQPFRPIPIPISLPRTPDLLPSLLPSNSPVPNPTSPLLFTSSI